MQKISRACAKRSEMVRYLDIVVKLTSILKNLRTTDRGSWLLHLQAIQDMVPVLCQSGSISYE